MRKLTLIALFVSLFAAVAFVVHEEPWKDTQLVQPAQLAKTINNPNVSKPYIFSVGPAGIFGLEKGKGIKGAEEFGAATSGPNLESLKSRVLMLDRNSEIVVYCGCCSTKDCPNIKPAFSMLSDLGFSNHKVLDFEHNLMLDWIEKGYPMNK